MAIPSLKGKAIPSFNPTAKLKINSVVESEKQTIKQSIKGSYKTLTKPETAQKAFEKLHKAWALAKPEKTVTVGVSLSITHCFTSDYDASVIHKIASEIRQGFEGDFLIQDISITGEKSEKESLEFVFSCYFDPEQNQFRRGDYF